MCPQFAPCYPFSGGSKYEMELILRQNLWCSNSEYQPPRSAIVPFTADVPSIEWPWVISNSCSFLHSLSIIPAGVHFFVVYITERMIRRMADKFGHIGQPRSPSHAHSHYTYPSSSTTSSVISTPPASLDLHRGSISTQRTSISEWSKKGESMEVVKEGELEPEPSKVALRTHAATGRPKGSYRLADFIIQRTLGTGSFGRVHLGKLYLISLCHTDI